MPFIGNQTSTNSKVVKYTYTATANQTDFNAIVDSGDEVAVYLNGILLKQTTDYTYTTSIVSLVAGASVGDIVEVHVFVSMVLADAVRASGDTMTGELVVPTVKLSSNIIKASDGGSAITLDTSDNVTLAGNLVIPDGGNIGSASDTDSISIASNGKATFSAGIANSGTIDAGTFNGLLGELAQLKVYTHSHTTDFTDGGTAIQQFGTSLNIPSSGNPNGSKFLIIVGGGRWATGNSAIKCRPHIRYKEGSDFTSQPSTEGTLATKIIQPCIGNFDGSMLGALGVFSYTNSSGSAQSVYLRSAADLTDGAPQNPSWNAGGDDGQIGIIALKIQ